MKRYLLVNSSSNTVEQMDELDDFMVENLDEMVMEMEIIDLEKELFYRPCGWQEIE